MIFDEPVKAWLGQDPDGAVVIFTECDDSNEHYIYSWILSGGAWVTPQKIHKVHVKKIEKIVKH